MRVLALTGSIAMGKSTTAAMFAAEGVPVSDADATVHALYRRDAVAAVEAAFPGTTGPGGVDRQRLSAAVLGNTAALRRLEAIVHPMVRAADDDFRDRAAASGYRLCLLDIPLLFESRGTDAVDAIIVVTAPSDVQRARVLSRPGMTETRFNALLSHQVPDAEKRAKAHFLVDTGDGMDPARRQVRDIVRALAGWT